MNKLFRFVKNIWEKLAKNSLLIIKIDISKNLLTNKIVKMNKKSISIN